MERVLILGRDGRTFALAKRIREQATGLGVRIVCIPGSPAMEGYAVTIPNLDTDTPHYANMVLGIAEKVNPTLVIAVGVDVSATGVVEQLREEGYTVFGVGQKGIILEDDRGFANAKCNEVGIRVPKWATFVPNEGDTYPPVEDAIDYVKSHDMGWVVKVGDLYKNDVHVCSNKEETLSILEWLKNQNYTGEVVLEEKMNGIEVSFTVAVTKGQGIVPIVTVFEHKRLVTGNMGCMTGEMGSLVLADVDTGGLELFNKLTPVLKELDYEGLLDINCILEKDGSLGFIEFTCRWGDPTAEILLPMIQDNIVQLMKNWANGYAEEIGFKHKVGVGVVLASSGYPYDNACMQGIPITIEGEPEFSVMSATVKDNRLYTKGGRQLIALGYDSLVDVARAKAYDSAKKIRFIDKIYRTDISIKWDKERGACHRAKIGRNVK